jgi:hypothetical protein
MIDVFISLLLVCVMWAGHADVEEDQVGWDCMTMGNQVCGTNWDMQGGGEGE